MVPVMVAAFVVGSMAETVILSTTSLWTKATSSLTAQEVTSVLSVVFSVMARVAALPLMVAVNGILSPS